MPIKITICKYMLLLSMTGVSITLSAQSAESASSAPYCSVLTKHSSSAASVSAPSFSASEEAVLRHGSLQLGTYVETLLMADTDETVRALSVLAQEEIQRLENDFSAHCDSPVSRLNASHGQPTVLPPDVARVLQTALEIAEDTNGIFNPAIGVLTELWAIGFGGDSVPNDASIEKAVKLSDFRQIRVWKESVDKSKTEFPENERFFAQLLPGQKLDLGGIAKGFIGNTVAETLVKHGLTHGILNLGGDVFAIGEKSPGLPWTVGLQHPLHERGNYFATVRASDTAVVSSGGYERYFEKGGRRYSHIIDSKSGRPAATDLSSVTVIDKDGTKADALCTALFAMGWEKATAYMKRHPDLKVILLHENFKDARISPAASPHIIHTAEDIRLTISD